MRETAELQKSGTPRPDSVFMTPKQAESRKLATLLEVSQTLAGAHDLKSALARVLATLAEHHSMPRGLVLLLEPGGDELRLAASHGLAEGRAARAASYRVGEGITGRVAESGKAIIVPQISREPLFLDRLGERRNELPVQGVSLLGAVQHEMAYSTAVFRQDERHVGRAG